MELLEIKQRRRSRTSNVLVLVEMKLHVFISNGHAIMKLSQLFYRNAIIIQNISMHFEIIELFFCLKGRMCASMLPQKLKGKPH